MMLRAVTDRENDQIVRGGNAFTYEEYLQAAKASASLYDEKSSGRRSVNIAKTNNASESTVVDEITEYFVNMTKKRAPGATMSKDTWQTISEEGKTVWDKLTNSDKQKILQYAMKRAEAKGGISVNQTMIQELDHNMNPEEAGEPGVEDNSAEEQTTRSRGKPGGVEGPE